jgi:arginine/lysine/ornithine decarboxylase
MDNNKSRQIERLASISDRFLNDSDFIEILDALKQEYMQEIIDSSLEDSISREKSFYKIYALDEVKKKLNDWKSTKSFALKREEVLKNR